MLAQPKLADVMFICTMDKQHVQQAIPALRKGYHLVLEKPISPDLEECREILKVAKECNRKVIVCHVLRYTPFYNKLKELLDQARLKFFGLEQKTTYVYIDEFHRWNKLQQDSLLKALEEGVIRFIGSTTENPYFAVNNAVISRVRNIYEFRRHTPEDLMKLARRALEDCDRGFGNLNIKYEEEDKD